MSRDRTQRAQHPWRHADGVWRCDACGLRLRRVRAAGRGHSHIEVSHDHGKTWRRRGSECSRCVPLTTTNERKK